MVKLKFIVNYLFSWSQLIWVSGQWFLLHSPAIHLIIVLKLKFIVNYLFSWSQLISDAGQWSNSQIMCPSHSALNGVKRNILVPSWQFIVLYMVFYHTIGHKISHKKNSNINLSLTMNLIILCKVSVSSLSETVKVVDYYSWRIEYVC